MTGRVLVTGGAGFIGCNLAHRLLAAGRTVVVLDNFSRPGAERNLRWLADPHASGLIVQRGDVRDRSALRAALAGVSEVYHLAAQVAVTTSLGDPSADFEINARGTLNLLEEVRAMARPASVIFTSTNKVYGELADVALQRDGTRYYPCDAAVRAFGIPEARRLSFHSPYGCSKGAADQYVLDYGRVYGLRTAVFRMSCIYGPHQFGTEDQGWVAHFLIRAVEGEPITIYGDGLQVRDLLYVDDLVDALLAVQPHMSRVAGGAFNIGGGPAHTISLLELVDTIAQLQGERPEVRHEPWRHADQRYYVSDTRSFEHATGWSPGIGVREGIGRLYEWLLASRSVRRALMTRVAS